MEAWLGGASTSKRCLRNVCESSSRLVQWGNGGTVYPCFIGRVSSGGVPEKLVSMMKM
jgi:hypothetical protein